MNMNINQPLTEAESELIAAGINPSMATQTLPLSSMLANSAAGLPSTASSTLEQSQVQALLAMRLLRRNSIPGGNVGASAALNSNLHANNLLTRGMLDYPSLDHMRALRENLLLQSMLPPSASTTLPSQILNQRAEQQANLTALRSVAAQQSSLCPSLSLAATTAAQQSAATAAATQDALSHNLPIQPQDSLLSQQIIPAMPERRRGREPTFPKKLYQMLVDLQCQPDGTKIAAFLPGGCAFAIHKPKEFAKSVMPKYFSMGSFGSFQRQLNLYDFQRITRGPYKGAYHHKLFIYGQPTLCERIRRNNKNKGKIEKHAKSGSEAGEE